jgi:hydroxymethylbilane synthase
MKKKIIIGTRGSQLALWQANYTKDALEKLGVEVELKIIKTKGDKIQHLGFDKMEGKGFFTKEIEDQLLSGDVNIAVHSMKDLPTTSPEGLVVTAVSYRANPADSLIIDKSSFTKGKTMNLPEGAIVGTSSARRKAQLLGFRPDLIVRDIRGNVDTRLRKLKEEDYDAIVLAAAGFSRLEMDMSDFDVITFNPKEFIPAPAQGVLAFQTRTDDLGTRRILKEIHRSDVASCTNVERKTLNLIEGGCHTPIGIYCERDTNGYYHVWAAMADTWDSAVRRVQISSSTTLNLAEQIVERLHKLKLK